MHRDDISIALSRGMAIAGKAEFFTVMCNGVKRKLMAVFVWNQLDSIDSRHGAFFQLHRVEYPDTLYTIDRPVSQLHLIRDVLIGRNQSRNNIFRSAIFNDKFALNVVSMHFATAEPRRNIGSILIESKVLYPAEKCQQSIWDKLTSNGKQRDEYYVYCLIMIFMTLVSLIITTRCYIMEIMNEDIETERFSHFT